MSKDPGKLRGETRSYASFASEDARRPKSLRQWAGDGYTRMETAIDFVASGHSLRAAEQNWGVPRSTLSDHIRRLDAPTMKDKRRYLTDHEEEQLVTFLINCAEIGYPRSRAQVIALAASIMKCEGRCVQITDGWWRRFKARHPRLSLRKGESLSHVRLLATSRQVLDNYYEHLCSILVDSDIMTKPERIFNCDETGVSLEAATGRVIVEKGTAHPYLATSGDKKQITVLASVSASGSIHPPMIIFDRKNLPEDWMEGETPGTLFSTSSNGWIDSELFEGRFETHFLRHAP
eukprot:m.289493 g.289493  ORF g.289493 m.289493 type:complete len:291 (+) comp40715_c2_seq20:875-1747(+)